MASDELIFRVGEKRKIRHVVRAYGTPANVVGTVRDASGNAVASGEGGAAAGDEEGVVTLSYLWNTAGASAGAYTYELRYDDDGETLAARGDVELVPAASNFDRYVRRVAGWLAEGARPEDREVSWAQARDLVRAALREYEKAVPRLAATVVDLTAGVWQYALPTGWQSGLSEILAVEYPVTDSAQTKWWLPLAHLVVDDARGVWRFRAWEPTAGEQARLYWRAGRPVDETQDTVDEADIESVTQYAAGLQMLTLANRAARMNAPEVGASVVNARTKEQEYGARAKAMMAAAEAAWADAARTLPGPPEDAPGPAAQWGYVPGHGF